MLPMRPSSSQSVSGRKRMPSLHPLLLMRHRKEAEQLAAMIAAAVDATPACADTMHGGRMKEPGSRTRPGSWLSWGGGRLSYGRYGLAGCGDRAHLLQQSH